MASRRNQKKWGLSKVKVGVSGRYSPIYGSVELRKKRAPRRKSSKKRRRR